MTPDKLPNVPHPAGLAGIEIVFLEPAPEGTRTKTEEPRENRTPRKGSVPRP